MESPILGCLKSITRKTFHLKLPIHRFMLHQVSNQIPRTENLNGSLQWMFQESKNVTKVARPTSVLCVPQIVQPIKVNITRTRVTN